MQRRQFIMLGLGVGVSLSLGIGLYQTTHPSSITAQQDAQLVLAALLPALLWGALPEDPLAQQQALARSERAVLDFLPYLPQAQQQELQQLFGLLALQLGRLALTGQLSQLTQLSLSQRLQLLASWRDSYLQLLQQAFSGLRELLFAAYYGQPEHWQTLSYQAPEFNPDV